MKGPYTTLRDIAEGLQDNVSHGSLVHRCLLQHCYLQYLIVGLTWVSINRGMDKENTVHIHSDCSVTKKKKQLCQFVQNGCN